MGGESRSATMGLKLMDTQRNTQAVFSMFIDAVGKLKEKFPTGKADLPLS